MHTNQIILGDNLEVLRSLPSESVDLIYIDPPFFSNRNYSIIWGDKGEIRSFEDCWDGGVDTYINWMYKRVIELHRVLKPTGSMYLHCDWHADAYLRVYVMDKIFGVDNFRNMITWKRRTGTNSSVNAAKQFGNVEDTLFFYSKSNSWTFNPQFSNDDEDYKKYTDKAFNQVDESGRKYRLQNLTNPAYRPNLIYDYKGYKPSKNGWALSLEKMEQFDREGRLHFPKDKSGRLQRKSFLDELQGKPIQNSWNDITMIGAKERIGYPTQKPEALLERIIKASSNEGDVVLDCFVGGGTTIAVAERLGRGWIGIDQSPSAFGVSRQRIANMNGLFSSPFVAKTAKWDYDVLRSMDDFEFEKLVVKAIGGEPSKTKKGGDMGIDGIINGNSIISVKRSDNIGRNVGDNLRSAILRYRRDKTVTKTTENMEHKLQHGEIVNLGDYDGFIIAFSFGKGLKAELAVLEREEGFRILPLLVSDILPVASKPSVKLVVEIKIPPSTLLTPLRANDTAKGLSSHQPSQDGETQKGDYQFVATATTDDNRLIEFFAFTVLVKNKQAEWETLTTDNFNKSGTMEQILKTGEYRVIATATDEYGLQGADEVEVVVK